MEEFVKFSADLEIFEILRSEVMKYPESKLALMVNSKVSSTIDSKEAIKLSTERGIFRKIIHWLRYGQVAIRDFVEACEIYDVADEMGLAALTNLCYHFMLELEGPDRYRATLWLKTIQSPIIHDDERATETVKFDESMLTPEERSDLNSIRVFIYDNRNLIGSVNEDFITNRDPNFFFVLRTGQVLSEEISKFLGKNISFDKVLRLKKRTNKTIRPGELPLEQWQLKNGLEKKIEGTIIGENHLKLLWVQDRIPGTIFLIIKSDTGIPRRRKPRIIETYVQVPIKSNIAEVWKHLREFFALSNYFLKNLYEEIRIDRDFILPLPKEGDLPILGLGNGDILIAEISHDSYGNF